MSDNPKENLKKIVLKLIILSLGFMLSISGIYEKVTFEDSQDIVNLFLFTWLLTAETRIVILQAKLNGSLK